jgi:hypothetical protein
VLAPPITALAGGVRWWALHGAPIFLIRVGCKSAGAREGFAGHRVVVSCCPALVVFGAPRNGFDWTQRGGFEGLKALGVGRPQGRGPVPKGPRGVWGLEEQAVGSVGRRLEGRLFPTAAATS